MSSNKINLDKYYTPIEIAKQCVSRVYEILNDVSFSEIIEPSAGDGSFSLQLSNCISYDIEPEHTSIIKQDYLLLDIPYKKNRLVIGNPPFGEKMYLAQQFYKKSTTHSDYIAFILPISQLGNSSSLFEFDLIHSEDLGKIKYSDRFLHCCFNIYSRNPNGINARPKNKLKDVLIIRQDSERYKTTLDYDIRMCYWGNGSAGKILKEGENYSAEYKIVINNVDYKDRIIKLLNEVNWWNELNCIAMLKIQQFHLVNFLKKNIPEIE